MNMQSSFPLFETGQILSSSQLNELTAYLEQEERRTRSKAIGIGVLCGLEPWFDTSNNQLVLEGGVGITSVGHIITVPETRFDRISSYTPPDMERESHQLAGLTDPKDYPFFKKPNGDLINLLKLTAAGEALGPTHPSAQALTAADVNNRVVLLFLEGKVDGIDVCDVNECTDKGSLVNFNLRALLVNAAQVEQMISGEAKLADSPVDANAHPKQDLSAPNISKLNPRDSRIAQFTDLIDRIVQIFSGEIRPLYQAMNDAYHAYSYLLEELYPPMDFPEGPFPPIRASQEVALIGSISNKFGKNVFAIQHMYDLLLDLADSHAEFLAVAYELDAECGPHEGRFPMHLLLGPADREKPVANTAGTDTGLGPLVKPTKFRHHFVPSPLHEAPSQLLSRARALHYRTYLLSKRLSLKDIFAASIRVIPSRKSGTPLSRRAIPYYLQHADRDDLHRNWDYDRTIRNQLHTIHSHRLSSDGDDHPLRKRIDDHDFYRVEGILGKVMPEVLKDLVNKRDELGLSFGIEPVYLGIEFGDDVTAKGLNAQVKIAAQQSFLRLFHCKLNELDLSFRIVTMFLFSYLTRIVIGLSKSRPRSLAVLQPFVAVMAIDSVVFEEEPRPDDGPDDPNGRPGAQPGNQPARSNPLLNTRRTFTLTEASRASLLRSTVRESVDPGAVLESGHDAGVPRMDIGSVDARILGGSSLLVSALTDFASLSHSQRFAEERARSSGLLRDLRAGALDESTLTDKLTDTSEPDSMGDIYAHILNIQDGREFFDKIKGVVFDRAIGDKGEVATANLYPSMNLLDKTERLVKELKAERVAEFDFDQFDSAYVAFLDAYDAYIKYVDKIDTKADRELAEAQSEVISAYGQIASTGVRTGLRNMVDEFKDRTQEIYQESVFENFVRRHPSLEHQCGVPDGGTLVLAYTHKSLLGQVLGKNQPKLEASLAPIFAIANGPLTLIDPRLLFPPQSPTTDPLEDFVVVADFALPYRCCETECEILDFKPPVARIPPPKVISGIVRGIRQNQIDPSILENARLKVINQNTGKPVPGVKFLDGEFSFNADPGIYSIEVKNNGFQTTMRTLAVNEGGQHTENFELIQK